MRPRQFLRHNLGIGGASTAPLLTMLTRKYTEAAFVIKDEWTHRSCFMLLFISRSSLCN